MTGTAQTFRDFISRYVNDAFTDSGFADPSQTLAAEVVSVALPGMTADEPPVARLGPVICAAPDDHLPTLAGYEEVVHRLRQLAAHPAISRLAYIRQLSTTTIAASISAGHTRLEHLLGAFDVAVRLLRPAVEYMAQHPKVYGLQGPRNVRAVLVLAFLHDAFHPPLGHVLDPFSPVFFKDRKTPRLDDAARDAEFKRAQDYYKAKLHLTTPRPIRIPVVIELLQLVFNGSDAEVQDVINACVDLIEQANREDLSQPWKAFAFAFDILWSSVDHDRLDYIARDFVHVMVFLGAPYHLADVLHGLRCDDVGGEVRLIFGTSATSILQNLLNTRKQMYAWIYEAKEKARYDTMLQHATALLLDEAGCLYTTPPDTFRRDFLRLTDFDFTRIATTITQRPRRGLAAALAKDAMNNRPLVLCHYADVPNEQLAALEERLRIFGDHIGRRVVGIVLNFADAFGFEPNVEALETALGQVVGLLTDEPWINEDELGSHVIGERRMNGGRSEVKLSWQDSEHLFWTLVHGSGDFRVILEFERLVWAEVKRRSPSIAREVVDMLAKKIVDHTHSDTPSKDRGTPTADMFRFIDSEWPPIFIYMSLTGRGAGLTNNDKVVQREIVASEGADGQRTVTLRLPDREGVSHCWLAAYRPASVGPIGCEFDRVVDAAARELVAEGKWVTATALAELHHSAEHARSEEY